jgi:hypothetical protein
MAYFDPKTFSIQNAGRAWSYMRDGDDMRFELHSGDHWKNDRSGVERSEVASYKNLAFDQAYTINYKFMIEPGPLNTAKWLVIGQAHSTEDSNDAGVSPPFELDLVGDRMQIDARWSTPEQTNWSNVHTRTLYTDTHNVQRGHWYDIKITMKFDPFGDGMLDVWRDGVQLVNYDGPLGYNDEIGPYWKQGVYREASPETIAVNYSDFSLVEGTVDGTGTVSGTAGDDVLHGTSAKDTILGGEGKDILLGNAGNDFLNGQAGNDTMDGGSGDDVLHGLVGNDRLLGHDGDDRIVTGTGQNSLTGGNGADVFDFNALDQHPSASSVITDFRHGVDKIDLFDMDANIRVSGNQAFNFVGGNGFSGKAGELRFSAEILSADVNGDKVVDFHVRVPHATVTIGDLIL